MITFFKILVSYLKSPNLFSVNKWWSFEDFIVNEYCQHLLDNYFMKISVQGHCSKKEKNKWHITRLLKHMEKATSKKRIYKIIQLLF
jgi:hypothetical protein